MHWKNQVSPTHGPMAEPQGIDVLNGWVQMFFNIAGKYNCGSK